MAKVRILAVDGGGVRGIIPTTVLAYIEGKLIEKTGNPNARMADFLDFGAGTSTGSIIAGMVMTPNEKGRPAFKMKEAVQAYFDIAAKVFKKDWRRNLKTCWGLFGPKYGVDAINTELIKKFNHWKLNELLLPCAFTGYDTAKRMPVIYTNRDDKEKYGDYYLKDVVRGSTSIPSIFKPAYFRNGSDVNTIIDGGVFANNPSMVAYVEVLKTTELAERFNELTPEHALILSFGTGRGLITKYPYRKIMRWGKVRWFIPILNILLQGMSDVTNYEMETYFRTYKVSENFVRINPAIVLGSADGEDASAENMKNLHQDALNYISKNRTFLDNLAERLIKEDLKYSAVLF